MPKPQAPAHAFRLAELVTGQARVCRVLEAMLAGEHLPSLLFAGPTGVGKRTAAIRLAQAVNCEADSVRPCERCRNCRLLAAMTHPDLRLLMPTEAPKSDTPEARLQEAGQACLSGMARFRLGAMQEATDPRKSVVIDAVRWIRREVAHAPIAGRRRVVLVVGADRMKDEAANAFLKTLEEPQAGTTFVLTTDKPSAILDTIRSRCQLVRFADLLREDVCAWLSNNAGVDAEQAAAAAAMSSGSLGRALQFLRDPDSLLVQPAVEFFSARKQDNRAVLAVLRRLAGVPPPALVGSLLFLHREALRVRLGLDSEYAQRNPAVGRRAAQEDAGYWRRSVKYLVGRNADCGQYGLNPKLFTYTLLSAIRQRAGG